MATKIQSRNSANEALVEARKKQVIFSYAPTLATMLGAIRIFEASSKKYVDGVRTEEAGKLIMIPRHL